MAAPDYAVLGKEGDELWMNLPARMARVGLKPIPTGGLPLSGVDSEGEMAWADPGDLMLDLSVGLGSAVNKEKIGNQVTCLADQIGAEEVKRKLETLLKAQDDRRLLLDARAVGDPSPIVTSGTLGYGETRKV